MNMQFIKRNYGWLIVVILASLPFIFFLSFVNIDLSNLSISIIEGQGKEGGSTLGMMYHISGEFAIRWMTAVLTCTPFFIFFGVNSLYVRQAMGIATAVWSILHFIIFIAAEGFVETFTQTNYILGFIAVLILIPLLITTNGRSMRWLKSNWKKLQRLTYVAVVLSLLHIALLDKTWLLYAVVVILGFFIRIPIVKNKIIAIRLNRKTKNIKA